MMPKNEVVVEAWPVPPLKANGSRSPVVSCTAAEDMARQEYALQSDLAYQVQRFGVGHFGVPGVVDYDDMDLTTALGIVEESQKRWLELPRVVRDRYQSWANVEAAAASGELAQVLKAAGIVADEAAVPGASASDSAAGSGDEKPV